MNICIFTHTFPRFPGDFSAPFMGELAKVLGDIVKLFVLLPYDKKLNLKSMAKFRVVSYKYIWPLQLHQLGYSRTLQGDNEMSSRIYLLSPFLYFFGLLKLIWLIKKENIELVSAHWMLPNGFIAAIAKIITGTKYTITIPGSDVYVSGKNPLFKFMAKVAVSGAGCVIADSSYYLEQLKALDIIPTKSRVIRYGVDINKFNIRTKDKDLLRKLELSIRDKIILGVGRFVEKKGFIYLLGAFANVNKIHKDLKLILVGDGALRREFEDYVEMNNLTGQVVFPGMVSHDELLKYYNLADVFVMPSVRDEAGNIDASPVAMMEAMACGVSVIATKLAGSDDLIKDGETGYLIAEKDVNALTKSLCKILKKSNSKKIKIKVHNIAVKNFSTKIIASRYLYEFKECLYGSCKDGKNVLN